MADKAQLRRNLIRVAEGLSIIIGGWATLIFVMYLFKGLAVKYNLAASDGVAEWVNKHQQSSRQLFTLAGVLLSEICFILWESSIVYFAVRRLAYGRDRSEVLTYVGFSELKRAGYTLSGRRKQWPLITLMVWLGSSFLAPAFTGTTAWPVTDPNSYEIANFTQAIEPCLPDVYLTAQLVQVLKAGQHIKLDGCPEYSNVNNLISAGLVKLQAAQNESNALLKVNNITFLGGTGGVMPIGTQGLMPSGVWGQVPAGVRTPKGYDYTYELEQQGMSAEVNCTRPRPGLPAMITSRWSETLPGVANVSVFCPNVQGEPYTSFSGLYSKQSLTANFCAGLRTLPTSTNVSSDVSVDHFAVSLWDFDEAASPADNLTSASALNSGRSTAMNTTSIGGAATCFMRPYSARFTVLFNSTSNYFTSTEIPGTREYISGMLSNPAGKSFAEAAQSASARWLSFYPGVQASSQVFRSSHALTALQSSTDVVDGNFTPFNSRPIGANAAVAALGEYLIGRHNTTEIALADIEIFMQGAFEYVSTLKRLWETYGANTWDDEFGDEYIDATRVAKGVWRASTVGWGAGTITGDSSTQIVYISLIPIILFALMSWGMVAWSHYYDRPHGVAYVAECDPTDLTDCIIAASQGGLQGSFHRQALFKKDGGLKGARKVRIRLGQFYRKGEADGLPKLGFVDVD